MMGKHGKKQRKRTTGMILAALAAACLETADKSRFPCLNLLKKGQLGPFPLSFWRKLPAGCFFPDVEK